MKKLLIAVAAIVMATGAFAQTDKGNMYVNTQFPIGMGTSTPGFNFWTQKDNGSSVGLNLNAGYFVIDDLAVNVGFGWGYRKPKGISARNDFDVSLGARYYIKDVIPVGVNYMYHKSQDIDATSSMNFEAGYSYFIARGLAIEPMAYYNIPFASGSKGIFGLKAGVGLYF